MNQENEVDIANVLEKNAAIMDEAIQIMKTQSYQIQVLVDEIRAWRALYFVDGSRLRTEAINDAVIATNKSGILKGMNLKGQELE